MSVNIKIAHATTGAFSFFHLPKEEKMKYDEVRLLQQQKPDK